MSDFVRATVSKAAVVAAFLLCIAIGAILFWEYWTVGKFANDFSVYWRTANNPVSEAYFWKGRFPFPYAPTMLLWISPLAVIPKWPAFFLFGLISVAGLFLALRPYLTKSAIALTFISPAFVRGLCTGQVSVALAALMIWACGTANRIAAGAAFGVIASVKPQLVMLAPIMFILNRDWRAFNAAWVSFGVIVLAAIAIFGVERWPEWIGSMDHFHRAVTETRVITIGASPAMAAERLGFGSFGWMVAGTFAGSAVIYFCRKTEGLEKATAIGAGSIMAAPYALAYDLIILVPFLAMLLMKGRFLAFFGIPAMLSPLPLLVAGYELLRDKPVEGSLHDLMMGKP